MTQIRKLVIATRASRLALWQAEHVQSRLQALYPGMVVELLKLSTRGDEIIDRSLSKVGGKGLFVKELENALLEFPGCAVVITHDRWFLDRVASHILAYEGTDDNPDQWYWFEGNFEGYEENKIARLGPEAAKPHRSTYRRLTRD